MSKKCICNLLEMENSQEMISFDHVINSRMFVFAAFFI